MNFFISTSNALNKWLGLDLPRISADDGKGVGVQPITTDQHTIAWQCHIVENHYRSRHKTIIAVESFSRYTLIIPCDRHYSQQELGMMIRSLWLQDIVAWLEQDDALASGAILQLCQQMDETEYRFGWVKNLDMSINGHIADAQHWLNDMLSHEQLDYLSHGQANELSGYINLQRKSAKGADGKKQRFYPVERLLEYGLARFAGVELKPKVRPVLAPAEPDTSSERCASASSPQGSKVVSLDAYRDRRHGRGDTD